MPEPVEGLYHDLDLAQFYDMANPWREDFDYCIALADGADSVLDLGCGTGELAAALGGGRQATGVDPAAAMLDIAQNRPGGDTVTWLQADARTVRIGRTFDLIVLTGHAFQVFLTSADQSAVMATIAAHLKPEGRFIFDSRNPAETSWKDRLKGKNVRSLDHPRLGPVEAWSESVYDAVTGVLTYQNSFRVVDTGQVESAKSRIRFTPKADLDAVLASAGLAVDEWLGDWRGNPYHPHARDLIPLGRLA